MALGERLEYLNKYKTFIRPFSWKTKQFPSFLQHRGYSIDASQHNNYAVEILVDLPIFMQLVKITWDYLTSTLEEAASEEE